MYSLYKDNLRYRHRSLYAGKQPVLPSRVKTLAMPIRLFTLLSFRF